MKDLYEKVLARLQTVTELKFIDFDHGQLDYTGEERPQVIFPCALIDIQLPRTEDTEMKGFIQDCDALVTIRLGFQFMGNTSNAFAEAKRLENMAYFDIAEKVYKALQGWKDANVNAFSRKNYRTEKRPDKVKILNIPFATSFEDRSAVPA